jgi:hypothetical protein
METLIGEVPDDWRQLRLGEACDVLAGPSGESMHGVPGASSSIPMVTPRDIRDNRIVTHSTLSIEPGLVQKLVRYRLEVDDIVLVRTGELGRCARVTVKQEGWLVGTAVLRLRSQDSATARYLTHYLGHPAVRDWIRRNAMGSTIASLSSGTVRAMPFVVPPLATQVAIAQLLDALDEKIAIYDQISRTTVALRDALLQLLLTGSAPPLSQESSTPETVGPTRDSLRDLIERGELRAGDRIVWSRPRRGQRHVAVVLASGHLEIDGRPYDSVSSAATAVAGSHINGWRAWRREQDGALLDDLRRAHSSG